MSFQIKRIEASNKTIRLPNDLVERLEQLAQKNNISFNKLVVQCCQYALENLEKKQGN